MSRWHMVRQASEQIVSMGQEDVAPRLNMRQLVADYIKSRLQAAREGKPAVLVVDADTLAVIDAAVPQADLINAGFVIVDQMESDAVLQRGLRREKYHPMGVVYYVRATKNSMKRIMGDYETFKYEFEPENIVEKCFPCFFRGIDPGIQRPWYGPARLVMMPGRAPPGKSRLGDAVKWVSGRAAKQEHQKRVLKYVSTGLAGGRPGVPPQPCEVEVLTVEDSVFTLNMPGTLAQLYRSRRKAGQPMRAHAGDESRHLSELCDIIGHKLTTLLVAMNEAPRILHTADAAAVARGPGGPREDATVTQLIAESVALRVMDHKEQHPEWTPVGTADDDAGGRAGPENVAVEMAGGQVQAASAPKDRAVLLVLDRVEDLATALLHDTTTQCTMTDLLDFKLHTPWRPKGQYLPALERARQEFIMDARSDPVWARIRNEDVAKAFGIVSAGLQATEKFHRKKAELAARQARGDNLATSRLTAMAVDEKIKRIKTFMQKYRLFNEVLSGFLRATERGEDLGGGERPAAYNRLVAVEQQLATGRDDAAGISDVKLRDRVKGLLADSFVSLTEKVRLIALYVVCVRRCDASTVAEMKRIAGISGVAEKAIDHLAYVGISDDRRDDAVAMFSRLPGRGTPAATLDAGGRLCTYVPKATALTAHVAAAMTGAAVDPSVPGQALGAGSCCAGQHRDVPPTLRPAEADALPIRRVAIPNIDADDTTTQDNGTLLQGVKAAFSPLLSPGGTNAAAAAGGAGQGPTSRGGGGLFGRGRRTKTPAARDLRSGREHEDEDEEEEEAAAMGPSEAEQERWEAEAFDWPEEAAPQAGSARIIVFFAGGVTPAEMASLARLGKQLNREIIVGGTSVVTAKDVLADLVDTGLPGPPPPQINELVVIPDVEDEERRAAAIEAQLQQAAEPEKQTGEEPAAAAAAAAGTGEAVPSAAQVVAAAAPPTPRNLLDEDDTE